MGAIQRTRTLTAYMVILEGLDSKIVRIHADPEEIDSKTVFATFGGAQDSLTTTLLKWQKDLKELIESVRKLREGKLEFAPVTQRVEIPTHPPRTTPREIEMDLVAVESRTLASVLGITPPSTPAATSTRRYACRTCGNQGPADGVSFTRLVVEKGRGDKAITPYTVVMCKCGERNHTRVLK